jgi:hypothetical protein
MERTDVLELMATLKLYGMRTAYDCHEISPEYAHVSHGDASPRRCMRATGEFTSVYSSSSH